jgi:hypothetical protein
MNSLAAVGSTTVAARVPPIDEAATPCRMPPGQGERIAEHDGKSSVREPYPMAAWLPVICTDF